MMKLSGNNIISDDDITITGKQAGKNLSEILDKQQDDIDKLKSNVKWLYKYGGVGSGSGNNSGGGTSTLSWSIFSTLDNNQIKNNNNPITLNGANTYSFYIKINQPQGATFNVKIIYNSLDSIGKVITKTISTSLDINNSYSNTIPLLLNCNGKIIIEVTDSIYNDKKMLSASYIIDAFKAKCELIDNNGSIYTYSTGEVFIGIAKQSGIKLKYSYEIAIPGNYKIVIRYTTINDIFPSILKEYIVNVEDISGKIDVIEESLLEDVISEGNLGHILIEVLLYNTSSQSIILNSSSLTFTLISNSLYLSVIPENGNIYNNSDVLDSEDIFKFSPGNINLKIRPYYERLSESVCNLSYKYSKIRENNDNDTLLSSGSIGIKFGQQHPMSFSAREGGKYCIEFNLLYNSLSYPGNNQYVKYYFVVEEPKIKLEWFGLLEDSDNILTRNYWIYGNNELSNIPLGTNEIYQNTINSEEKAFNITFPDVEGNTADSIITIGLQYSEINNTNEPLFIGHQIDTSNDSIIDYLTIYQNKIIIGGNTIDFFFPKERNFKKESSDNYHLLNIVSQYKETFNNNDYFEIIIYIDGIIEGALYTWSSNILRLNSFTIKKFNGFINLIDISYIKKIRNNLFKYNEDIIIYHNYICYYTSLLHPEDDNFENTDKYKVLEEIEGSSDFQYLNDGIQCDLSFIQNIAEKINIPTILFSAEKTETFNRNYNNKSYNEEDSTTPISMVNVQWCDGKENSKLKPVIPPETCKFYIEVQGSSTKTYKCKNWELSLKNTDESSSETYLFSPNYNNSDLNTFLPEESFTLKADVVDSSHSNNTSIGNFVNRVTKKFDTNVTNNSSYNNYVKNCLEGFPCLVFICYEETDNNGSSVEEYYYEGIYNFNLGRSSYHNLGYIDNSIFDNAENPLQNAENNFTFYNVLSSSNSLKPGLVIAEIQGNSAFFDFSQYDQTILFRMSNDIDSKEPYMFGDIVRGSGITENIAKNCIQKLVKNVALSGGYIFDTLDKDYNSIENDRGYQNEENISGYKRDGIINTEENSEIENPEDKKRYPLNQVPDYHYQFFKSLSNEGYTFKEKSERLDDGNLGNLHNLITLPSDDEGESDRKPYVDFRSLSEYYTICMAFGLVDSVQKNMNIKTWTAKESDSNINTTTWYTAFYDMDTCLGINNSGNDVEYFAFSDYWGSNENQTGEIDSSVDLLPATIYRDYSPNNPTNYSADSFFDTPSSYLFAVAKYSRMGQILSQTADTADFPQELWARWRSMPMSSDPTTGCLQDARHFVNKYFSNNLKNVPEILINLNYRNKYLIKNDNNNSFSFDTTNFPKFHGTRIAKVTDWLDGRLHILDAYFNLNKSDSLISHYETNSSNNIVSYTNLSINGSNVLESKYEANYYLKENPDIFILQDIFSSSNNNVALQGVLSISETIEARKLSPLVVDTSNLRYRYLIFKGDNTRYNLKLQTQGLQTASFYGSSAWTFLSSINTFDFKGNEFYINSRYLENLVGNSTKTLNIREENIIMPNLKTIELTGPNYSGKISNTENNQNKFLNLESVNISNSKLSLELSNSNCKSVYFDNINSTKVQLINCHFDTIQFSNVTLDELLINPFPIKNILISSDGLKIEKNFIKSIIITGINEDIDSKITISDEYELTALTINTISNITIKNCPKLRNIHINEGSENKVKRIYIEKCGDAANTITINSSNSGEFNLQDFVNLEKLTIRSIDNLITCKVGSAFELGEKDFYNNKNFKYLNTNGNKLTIINGDSLFAGDYSFTLKDGENGSWCNLEVSPNCSSIAKIFSGTTKPDEPENSENKGSKGALDLDAVIYFINNCILTNNNITNINYSFWYNSIIIDTYNSGKQLGDVLTKFKKVTKANRTFARNNITYYSKDLFNFGSDSNSIEFNGFCQNVLSGSFSVIARCNYLENIISKIDYLGQSQYHNTHLPAISKINFVKSNGANYNSDEFFKVKDIFGDSSNNSITTLSGYDITNSKIDFKEAFDKLQKINYICNSFNGGSSTRINFDKLFYNCDTLKYIHHSFMEGSNDNPANLYTIFNWEQSQILTTRNIFLDYPKNTDGSLWEDRGDSDYTTTFTIKKYIFYEDYNKLVNILLKKATNNTHGINCIFNNCTRILPYGPKDAPEYLILSFKYAEDENQKPIREGITHFCDTFNNFKQVYLGNNDYNDKESIIEYIKNRIIEDNPSSEDAEAIISGINDENYVDYSKEYLEDFFSKINSSYKLPIVLDVNFFKYISHIQYYFRTFKNIKLGSNLPLNFFQKRYKSEKQCYIEDDNSAFKSGNYITYDYRSEIINLYSLFDGVEWSDKLSLNNNQDDFIDYAKLNEHSREELPYYNKPYSFNSYLFDENGEYIEKIKELYYNKFVYNDNNEEKILYEGNLYSYINGEYRLYDNIKQGDELKDTINLLNCTEQSGIYQETIELSRKDMAGNDNYKATINNTTLNNSETAERSFIIAPDLLYGCKSELGSITSKDNSYSLRYLLYSINSNWSTKLEGIMPDHFFKNCKKYPFNNAFSNVKLLPRYYKTVTTFEPEEEEVILEHKKLIYTFFPENFTKIDQLQDNCFRTLIMLPPPMEIIDGGTIEKKFFIFNSNSIPKTTKSLANSLPNIRGVNNETSWTHRINTSSSYIYTQNIPNNNYYNIMVTVSEGFDEENNSILIEKEGIDFINYFKDLSVNGLVTGGISAFLVGKVFSDDCNRITKLKLIDGDKNYVISAFGTPSSQPYGNVINRNFILPVGDRQFNWGNRDNKFPFIYFPSNQPMQLSRTENCSNDNQGYYGNYKYLNNSGYSIILGN